MHKKCGVWHRVVGGWMASGTDSTGAHEASTLLPPKQNTLHIYPTLTRFFCSSLTSTSVTLYFVTTINFLHTHTETGVQCCHFQTHTQWAIIKTADKLGLFVLELGSELQLNQTIWVRFITFLNTNTAALVFAHNQYNTAITNATQITVSGASLSTKRNISENTSS